MYKHAHNKQRELLYTSYFLLYSGLSFTGSRQTTTVTVCLTEEPPNDTYYNTSRKCFAIFSSLATAFIILAWWETRNTCIYHTNEKESPIVNSCLWRKVWDVLSKSLSFNFNVNLLSFRVEVVAGIIVLGATLIAGCGTNDKWNQLGGVTEPDRNRKKSRLC